MLTSGLPSPPLPLPRHLVSSSSPPPFFSTFFPVADENAPSMVLAPQVPTNANNAPAKESVTRLAATDDSLFADATTGITGGIMDEETKAKYDEKADLAGAGKFCTVPPPPIPIPIRPLPGTFRRIVSPTSKHVHVWYFKVCTRTLHGPCWNRFDVKAKTSACFKYQYINISAYITMMPTFDR